MIFIYSWPSFEEHIVYIQVDSLCCNYLRKLTHGRLATVDRNMELGRLTCGI